MKLTVFGATGATGTHLVGQALAAGHQVTAVARRPQGLRVSGADHQALRVVRADLDDSASLDEAVNGSDAVLSALGSRGGKAPTIVYSDGITGIIAAMGRAGVRRVIAVSAVPVGAPADKSRLLRHVVHPLLYRFFGGAYHDMARMEDLLAASDRDWTVFRPPRLTDKPATGRYRTDLDRPLPRAATLPRGDLAAAMLAAVGDLASIGRVVTIAR
jgi:putative NADH-flavin reductase